MKKNVNASTLMLVKRTLKTLTHQKYRFNKHYKFTPIYCRWNHLHHAVFDNTLCRPCIQ